MATYLSPRHSTLTVVGLLLFAGIAAYLARQEGTKDVIGEARVHAGGAHDRGDPSPTIHVVLRSFTGHKALFDTCFGPSIDAFMDWRSAHLTIILDMESPADHAWGAELEQRFAGRPFAVRYAEMAPQLFIETYLKFSNLQFAGEKFNTPGYVRQLFDTYYFDTYLPASSGEDDIVCICDTDAQFLSMLPSITALSSLDSTNRRRVVLRQQVEDPPFGWYLDGPIIAGNFSSETMPCTVGVMEVGNLHNLFFKRTFSRLRRHVTAAWNASSFSDALVSAILSAKSLYSLTDFEEAKKATLSPINTLMDFALLAEPDAYEAAVIRRPGPAAPVFSFNAVCDTSQLRAGCCRIFNFSSCSTEELFDFVHIMVHPVFRDRQPPFTHEEMRLSADRHYADVANTLQSMALDEKNRMRLACSTYGGFHESSV